MIESSVKIILTTISICTILFFVRRFVWPITINVKLLKTDQVSLSNDEQEWPGQERQRIRDQRREL
jgi:hypothetical protein